MSLAETGQANVSLFLNFGDTYEDSVVTGDMSQKPGAISRFWRHMRKTGLQVASVTQWLKAK
jgi:hypothetical protein